MIKTEELDAKPQEAPPRERTRRRGGDLWWAVPGALVGAVVIYVAHRGLVDDAYITLSYVRNVAEHLHWGMIPTEESNTATSPLNVVLLALATWVGGVTGELRPVLGLGILTVALSAAMAVWAAQIARRINVSGAWSLAVLALVFANPFVNSALVLEVVPIAAFLTGLTARAVHGRRLAFGVLAGLLVLTRPDLGIVVAVVYLVTPALRRHFWVVPLTAIAVVLPWYAFRCVPPRLCGPDHACDQDAAEVVRRCNLRQRAVEDVAGGDEAATGARPRPCSDRPADGIVKLLTLCGGCEDWSLWRLRRGTRATGIRSRSSGTRCGCITVSR